MEEAKLVGSRLSESRCGNGCCESRLMQSDCSRGLTILIGPQGIKLLQRNWIGRSEGAEIDFKIERI